MSQKLSQCLRPKAGWENQQLLVCKHFPAASRIDRSYFSYTVNLALALARRGIRTGILDTDIFGPSIPTLLNLHGEPRLDSNNCLIPLTNYGLKSMSMGYLLLKPRPLLPPITNSPLPLFHLWTQHL